MYRHFDCYAVIRHTAQDLAAERVLVYVDTGVHPDQLSSRFAHTNLQTAMINQHPSLETVR